MTPLEALIEITQIMLNQQYVDNVTVGDIARNVRRVSEALFQWTTPDYKEQHELVAILALCERFNISTKDLHA